MQEPRTSFLSKEAIRKNDYHKKRRIFSLEFAATQKTADTLFARQAISTIVQRRKSPSHGGKSHAIAIMEQGILFYADAVHKMIWLLTRDTELPQQVQTSCRETCCRPEGSEA
ncbi:MAG: hypothetical protein ACLSHC_11825 [Bilophila wadsworthia]